MKIETKAIHVGDRKADPAKPGAFIPVTTPIYTAASYIYESTAQLDRVLGREEEGFCYARYDNPPNAALEELMASLENGHGALACSSGIIPLHLPLLAPLTHPPTSLPAATATHAPT